MVDADVLDLRVLTQDHLKIMVDNGTPEGEIISVKIPSLLTIFKVAGFSKDLETAKSELDKMDQLDLFEMLQKKFKLLFPELKAYTFNELQITLLLQKVMEYVVPADVSELEKHGITFVDDEKKVG